MEYYLEYFNKYEKEENENETIGIILIKRKDMNIKSDKLYQIRYIEKMPSIKELKNIIKENKIFLLKR